MGNALVGTDPAARLDHAFLERCGRLAELGKWQDDCETMRSNAGKNAAGRPAAPVGHPATRKVG